MAALAAAAHIVVVCQVNVEDQLALLRRKSACAENRSG